MKKQNKKNTISSSERRTQWGMKLLFLFLLGLCTIVFGYYLWPEPTSVQNVNLLRNIENPLEILQTARIYPNPAYVMNTLKVRLEDRYWTLKDSLTYKWFRNNRPILEIDGTTMGPDFFRKGDEIFVEAHLKHAGGREEIYRTPIVRIMNSTPRIVSATTTLQQDPGPKITAEIRSMDADGDPIVYFYNWFKNGEEITGETGPTLDPSNFQRGDKIFAKIVADDGEDRSSSFTSELLFFENNPPRIVSNPPPQMGDGRLFVYQLEVKDPDGDPLSFELVESPPGMKISQSGRIDWPFPPKEIGGRAYTVTVIVRDASGGEASQTFEIALSAAEETTEEE